MGLEIVTKDMIVEAIDPETAPVYLKVILKRTANFPKIEEKVLAIPKSDRKFVFVQNEEADSYWIIYGYDKYFRKFPEFQKAHNLFMKSPKLL